MKKLLILASILIASSSFASELIPVKEPLVQIDAYCGGSLRYRGKVSANDLNFLSKIMKNHITMIRMQQSNGSIVYIPTAKCVIEVPNPKLIN